MTPTGKVKVYKIHPWGDNSETMLLRADTHPLDLHGIVSEMGSCTVKVLYMTEDKLNKIPEY